jgi:hypothetical protein
MGKPHIDDIVLRAGEEQIAVCIEFDLSQGPFVAWIKRFDGFNAMDMQSSKFLCEPCKRIGL